MKNESKNHNMKTKNPNVKRTKIGSDIFNTDVVKTNEYVIFAKVMQRENVPVPIIAARIKAIDRMLLMQRQGMLNSMHMYTRARRKRKNVGLMFHLEKIVEELVIEENEISLEL